MSGKPWTTAEGRRVWIIDQIEQEAVFYLGDDQTNFGKRCESRCFEQLRGLGIGWMIAFWIVKTVVWELVKWYWFSDRAKRLRAIQDDTDNAITIQSGRTQ